MIKEVEKKYLPLFLFILGTFTLVKEYYLNFRSMVS